MKVPAMCLALLGLAMMMCHPAATNASTVLSDNLAAECDFQESVYGIHWWAASFGTDAISYTLEDVTLLMREAGSGGAAEVDIYTDASFCPGSLVGALTSPTSYPSDLANVTFTASGITLDPNATYWVVLKALSGTYWWAGTFDTSGSGVGFQGTYGFTSDAGATWYIGDNAPQMMAVKATAIPIPPTVFLLGSGLMPLAWARCRKRWGK